MIFSADRIPQTLCIRSVKPFCMLHSSEQIQWRHTTSNFLCLQADLGYFRLLLRATELLMPSTYQHCSWHLFWSMALPTDPRYGHATCMPFAVDWLRAYANVVWVKLWQWNRIIELLLHHSHSCWIYSLPTWQPAADLAIRRLCSCLGRQNFVSIWHVFWAQDIAKMLFRPELCPGARWGSLQH